MANNATCHNNERNPLDGFAITGLPAHTDAEHPPDGGYGWICLIACFNINCFTWGVVAVRPTKPTDRRDEELLTANIVLRCFSWVLS